MAPGRAASRLLGYSMFEGRPATTKGGWFNPIVFAHLRAARAYPRLDVDRPIFIIGMGRSGTTLLGRLFAAHPDVGFLNEPKAMWHVAEPGEDIIGSYSETVGRLYLDAGDATDEVKRRARALFSWYAVASRSKRVVDKYPEHLFRMPFVRAIFPDAVFVLIVRGPWSTLKSVSKWSEVNARDSADWWGVRDRKWHVVWEQGVLARPANGDLAALDLADTSDHLVRAAVEWVVTMREAAAALGASSTIALSYESLSEQPRMTMERLLELCGLPPSPRTIRYAEAVTTAGAARGAGASVERALPGGLRTIVSDVWADLKPKVTGLPEPASH